MSHPHPAPNSNKKPRKKKPSTGNPKGRPSLLTEANKKIMLAAARNGCPVSRLFHLIKVDHSTVTNWRNWAATGKEPYASLFSELDQAHSEAIAKLYGRVMTAGKKDWRASAYLIERLEGKTLTILPAQAPVSTEDGPATASTFCPGVVVMLQGVDGMHNPYQPPEPADPRDQVPPSAKHGV